MPSSTETSDICIVGGCGHVGLPLGIAFSNLGKKVVLYDINEASIKKINKAEMPFMENGAQEILKKVIKNKKLHATNNPAVISNAKAIIMVTGTPVDEHLNPKLHDITNGLKEIEQYLRDDQLLVLRSTLYPGITNKVFEHLQKKGKKTLVAFCPERIAEGHALEELSSFPQIVGGCTYEATKQASELFKVIAKKIIVTKPVEAELAKLFTNTWRYINFAISNQFYMIANAEGLDFYSIYDAMTEDYPRLKSFAKAGLAAGPCLFKDTMQLSSFSGNNFFLGHAAMLVNEGLPDFIVDAMKDRYILTHRTVGILGMAFKGNNDDPRESLSYKLKKKLEIEAGEVLCHDPYVKDERLVSLDEIKKRADIVLLAAPHSVYSQEDWAEKDLVDIWNFYGQGGLI
jgi:UDP-N-acetyl-D-mannosaminuronic acid dehydrogenase